ncbi:hypothetical protein MIND_00492300 [Mycena indigotica]|uniref:DH domain-containing protein n=1 Tax=Mycena indigotica TaxID=2126181 RepID=A0A8H6SVK7_9AGAR|nr:uncharacterized protein MIND_00492300 [Mycena indigotica]KAF7306995.1 hypothetical protein MIND_00492300 [Mycena indigotica]
MNAPLPAPPSSSSPPSLPPKGFNGSHLDIRPSMGTYDASSLPASPMSPTGVETSLEAKQRRANPLTDLIDTEKSYVDQLTGIIRKVAAAWSRSNLPPQELDTIFRSIEGVYKANRTLLTKLKDIGTNPSSPKALGDLLMRWIDDLEVPYTTYCTRFCGGFDEWEPVQSNSRLPSIISGFSAANPPPAWAMAPDIDPPTWTLDGLFLLPKARLKYYRKLYARLLKSTTPGRSDHRLLVGALDKLDKLLDTLEAREQIRVGVAQSPPELSHSLKLDNPPLPTERSSSVSPRSTMNGLTRSSDIDGQGGSETSSARGSSLSSGERLSRDTASTSISRVSSTTMTAPISDLERRLSTQRTLDIFTMRPKVVRLQMSPPSLHFTREFRFSMDVVVRFTPRSTGVEVVHRMGHLFLLSDLFLICERMTPEERSQQNSSDGADMWLCYPPLAGKVLRVAEVEGEDNALEIAIMRKETLIIQAESVHVRNFMLAEFRECIAFASSLPPPSNQPVPPVPPIAPHLSQQSLPPVPERGPPPPAHNYPPNFDNQGNMPTSSMSQPFFASPGQVMPPTRSASSGSGLSRAGSDVSEMQPRSSYPLPQPPQRAPSAPMPGMSGSPQPPYPQRAPSAPMAPPRPPSEPQYLPGPGLRKSSSARSLQSQYSQQEQYPPPPLPALPPGGYPTQMHAPQPRNWAPSGQLGVNGFRNNVPSFHEPSPPNSPVEETPRFTGPLTSTISAEMKCKVFLKQQHAQWKSLGAAKLKLYKQSPTNVKQLVVEKGKGSIIISTIVLTDGVERVGRTGVAIELSDKGARTGIVYMLQLRDEKAAGGLFDDLIAGSDRLTRLPFIQIG